MVYYCYKKTENGASMGNRNNRRNSNTIRCAYSECKLPNDNARFGIQFFYLFISVLFLFKDPKSFSFFAIAMYTVPILLDLAYSQLNGCVFKAIRVFFLVFNGCIVSACILGLFGFIVDNEDTFTVIKTSLVLADCSLKKAQLVVPLLLELVVPVIMFFGSPNKRSRNAIEYVMKEAS